ncbi:MAG: neutral/alkaline non-lysosomal ceramidase N-terminal domain-containing protein [Clostridia bacterium]|nr:neutral/alkaline non-lysosomal ceramidase N-terminal domain-containing protein [Clostridia bacterium]
MRAGFGKSDLTPPMGVELAGYGYYLGRSAQSVRDRLYARALLLEDGAMRTLIICCDLLGLSRAVCGAVFAHAKALGVPQEHTIIVSIHTHTGPAIKYHEGCGYTDDNYVATVAPAICKAVDAAAADLDEAAALTYICAPFDGDHIYNRTITNGPVDRHVRGFRLTRASKADIAIVSAACHGVFRGRVTAVSADFAGEICRRLDNQGLCSIYLNGLCGDIDPTRQNDELLDSFAQLVVSRYSEEKTALPMTLGAGSFPFTLKLIPVEAEDIRAAAAQAAARAGGDDMPAARVARIWEREMLEKLSRLSGQEDIAVKYIMLGGIPVMALPFEGFTQIGMDIRRICHREDALILGCAEELLGYLPTKDDISRGTYAALESTFLYKRLPVVPGEAERLGEEMGLALERVLS